MAVGARGHERGHVHWFALKGSLAQASNLRASVGAFRRVGSKENRSEANEPITEFTGQRWFKDRCGGSSTPKHPDTPGNSMGHKLNIRISMHLYTQDIQIEREREVGSEREGEKEAKRER